MSGAVVWSMHPVLRVLGIGCVFTATTVAWLVLGGTTANRRSRQTDELGGRVNELWGRSQAQAAPSLTFYWEAKSKSVPIASTSGRAAIHLDRRLKGLVWYALYDVAFRAIYTYVHEEPQAGYVELTFQFPDSEGMYDDFKLLVDGAVLPETKSAQGGRVTAMLPVGPGQEISISVEYKSRGMDRWAYVPGNGVTNLRNFDFRVETDFLDFDFPPSTMSPSAKTPADRGMLLDWKFAHAVTGRSIGLEMPTPIQPGELAASLAFSAPISLFFFFLIVFVLATLRQIDIHPINYLFIAGGFFSFHLLFAYVVDHIEVIPAFALSSAVTVLLVVSYLRLVVSNRFAFVEAAIAQLVFLIGFSLAHFWEGFTGLTITALSILTLATLMQLTGRIRWSQVLSRST